MTPPRLVTHAGMQQHLATMQRHDLRVSLLVSSCAFTWSCSLTLIIAYRLWLLGAVFCAVTPWGFVISMRRLERWRQAVKIRSRRRWLQWD